MQFVSGVLHLLETGLADLSGNTRIILGRDLDNVIFLFPLFASRLIFLIPKKNWNDVNLLSSLFEFFDVTTRIIILVTFLLTPLMVCFLERRDKKFNSLIRNYILEIAIMTQVSMKLPKNWPSRCIIGSYTISWLILSNTYAGKMIEFLNTNLGLRDIKTVEELLRSDLIINIPSGMVMLYSEENPTTSSQSYRVLHEAYKAALIKASKGDKFAFADEFNFAEIFQTKKYAVACTSNFAFRILRMMYDATGNDLITTIDSGSELLYATLVPRDSPFVETFNEILMQMVEAGIESYQTSLAEADSNLLYIDRIKNGKIATKQPQSITLNQLSYIFYLYLASVAITFCVFLSEILTYLVLLIWK